MEEEQQTKLSKSEEIFNFLIDSMFRIWDESKNWWNIGLLSSQIASLRKIQYSQTLSNEELTKVTEEIEKLSKKQDELKNQCFSKTPLILFIIIFVIFVWGIIYLTPVKRLLPNQSNYHIVFNGQFGRVRDLPFSGHSVITSVKWFNGKLYVGGDGGLTAIDAITGLATHTESLPKDFFVRDLKIDGNSMLIAGFPGIFKLENNTISNIYSETECPEELINSISVAANNSLLIGTIGNGLLKFSKGRFSYAKETNGRTIKAFGRQKNELWLMCEDEILTGDGEKFKPLMLQVLVGKRLMCMETSNKNVYIGTDQGVVAGYSSARSQVWTLLSSGKPGHINDIVVGGNDVLFIGSDEGVYRYYNGKLDCVSVVPCSALDVNEQYLAAVNRNSVMFFEFSAMPNMEPIPELGTFTPDFPIIIQESQNAYQYERYHDFGIMENDGKTLLATSQIASTTENQSNIKDYVKLPSELQKPVFSDVKKINDNYLLATKNRGLWVYSNNEWLPIENAEKSGAYKICKIGSFTYVYGDSAGIFKIDNFNAEPVVEVKDTCLLNSIIAENTTLYMLFNDGSIKKRIGTETTEISVIPSELANKYHSMWKIGNKLLVVTEKGILHHTESGSWNLLYLKDSMDTTKVVAATKDNNDNLYLVLSDGKILKYKNEKYEFLGVVSDRPLAMGYSSFLWVATRESLFILKDHNKENSEKTFVKTPLYIDGNVIGAFQAKEKNSVLIFTDSGVKIIQIVQDK